ncbi:MAG: [FeFe] hydrogenase H-cluster radical SAM maturase HydE [Clostridiales bacterium]|nr:[FeFe] hydrogenase H-cluster radical SAM maturase HydE [Clostridiales bacterium]
MQESFERAYPFELADKLEAEGNLTDDELKTVLLFDAPGFDEYLAGKARAVREKHYGKEVYLRGLIEFTNYCKNNCYYCGIRRGNANAERYRLSEDQILSCCDMGYELGFRTFVLQGGEDPYYTDELVVSIVSGIKERHPDCAVTLSIGEREKESYQKFFDAGADRYLLRHETADKEHYGMLHPDELSFDHRMQCLRDLKEIGYQVGTGMMVGSPYQTTEHLVKDLRFLKDFGPEMVGIGPFIPHHDTQFADCKAGTVDMTLRLLSMIRLMLPDVLLPATTALGTIDPRGREKGILAGANVVMPNLSPSDVRGKYLLYDNKICTGDEAAECIRCMAMRISSVGYETVVARGDHIAFR